MYYWWKKSEDAAKNMYDIIHQEEKTAEDFPGFV